MLQCFKYYKNLFPLKNVSLTHKVMCVCVEISKGIINACMDVCVYACKCGLTFSFSFFAQTNNQNKEEKLNCISNYINIFAILIMCVCLQHTHTRTHIKYVSVFVFNYVHECVWIFRKQHMCKSMCNRNLGLCFLYWTITILII